MNPNASYVPAGSSARSIPRSESAGNPHSVTRIRVALIFPEPNSDSSLNPKPRSSLYALVLVLGNLLLGAGVITWSARVSPGVMFGAVLFGYIARLGIITAAVLPIRDSDWFEVVPFAVTLLVTHLGLLVWEARHVAASLAFPGLKPGSEFMIPSDPQERPE